MSIKELAPTYYTRLQEVIKEVNKSNRLLNAGCGDGWYEHLLSEEIDEIVSFDFNKGDIQIAKAINPKNNINYYIGDIESIPIKNNTFDCIICIDVLEHLKEDENAIKELIRILKKGGKLIITVPSKDFPFPYDPINYLLKMVGKKYRIGAWGWGHKRLYTIEELEKKIMLKVVENRNLSHSLVGAIENSYINNYFQRLTKNDPKNQSRVSENIDKIKRSVKYRPPKLFTRVRDLIIWLDNRLFSKSKKSIGVLVVFQK